MKKQQPTQPIARPTLKKHALINTAYMCAITEQEELDLSQKAVPKLASHAIVFRRLVLPPPHKHVPLISLYENLLAFLTRP